MPTGSEHNLQDAAGVRRVVGCMTGTSLDGIDCALVEVEGAGLRMRPRFVRGVSGSLGDIAPRLRALADQERMTAAEIAGLAREFALLHAREVRRLLGRERCDLISVHGQTVYHRPPVSWQLFSPAVLAHEVGVDVVCDLRAADLAAGGQGAPITPIADWVWLRSAAERRIVLNLGGFANATVLPRDAGPESVADIRGMDICACNHVLDAAARAGLGKPFDEDGAAAAAGRVEAAAREELMAILSRQSSGGRSLGTGDEAVGAGGWVERWRGRVSGEDLCATACAAVGEEIGRAIAAHAASPSGAIGRVLAAGGGTLNRALVRGITQSLAGVCPSVRVETTDAYGLPGQFRESAEMAVLGALCRDGVPITLAGVTGGSQRKPVAGVWAFASVTGLAPPA